MIDDLRLQAKYCQDTSPLYAALYEHLAGYWLDHNAGQTDPALAAFFDTVERCWQGRIFTAWFERPLLLAGALHEQALSGRASALAPFYSSCGGSFDASQGEAFGAALKATLAECHQDMAGFLSQSSIQTNETSRGLSWLLPVLSGWQETRPAVTLIELGCSAGLGLVADHYGYRVEGLAGQVWAQQGRPHFDMALCGAGAEAALASLSHVQAFGGATKTRIGCDLRPLNGADEQQGRILEALIWPDNAPRLARLRDAMKIKRAIPLRFEAGDMVDCIDRLATERFADTPMVCLFNTVATCYLDDDHYARLRAAIANAFSGLWADKDCLWVEFEMPRISDDLPDYAQGQEQLIKVHRPDGKGGLQTRYFGAATAHPKEVEIF